MRVTQEQSKICPEQTGAQSVMQDTAQDCGTQEALCWSGHLQREKDLAGLTQISEERH